MINIPDDLRASIRFFGSVRAALKRAAEIDHQESIDLLAPLVLWVPVDLERVQSGCRLVDREGVEYIMTDLFHLVRIHDGVTVNHHTGHAWPLEVRSCPIE
jgi:hypothetical protein